MASADGKGETIARPVLVSTIPHLPSFDVTFPVLARLQARGAVDLRCFVGRHLLRTEPRVQGALDQSGIPARIVGTLGLEIGALAVMARADAVFAHVDPRANYKRSRPRDTAIPALGRTHIYVQHGMFQYHLNYRLDDRIIDYYSKALLVWDALPPDVDDFISGDPASRSHVVGFLKKDMLGPLDGAETIRDALAGYRRRVLVCHSFGWEPRHSDAGEQSSALTMFEALLNANTDTAFILRSHRGRSGRSMASFDGVLADRCPNALISDRHEGLFRYTTIHDVMAQCDAVLTHPSTIILDASYRGLPVGLLDYDPATLAGNAGKIAHMPRIGDPEQAQRFLTQPETARDANTPLLNRYGRSIDDNLDRAAAAIEEVLGA